MAKDGRTCLQVPLPPGWQFRATRLTEEYPLSRYLEDLDENADLVLARQPNGTLVLLGPGREPPDAPGTVIVSFAPPRDEQAESGEPAGPARQ